jgi:hypothetical protein
VATRQLEQQASLREAELHGSLNKATRDLQDMSARCQAAKGQLAAKEQALAETQVGLARNRMPSEGEHSWSHTTHGRS